LHFLTKAELKDAQEKLDEFEGDIARLTREKKELEDRLQSIVAEFTKQNAEAEALLQERERKH